MGDYQIIAWDAQIARITVLYHGALFPIALDLPISPDGNVPVGKDLDQWIVDRTPQELIERKKQIGEGIKNADEIEKLVVPIISPPSPRPQEEIDLSWKTNIEGAVLLILKETGVISE